jgi:hypothetical protein
MTSRPTFLALLGVLALSFSTSLLAAPAAQVQFFEHIASGDIRQLMSVMDAKLRGEFDAPVLDAWMVAFNERLGSVQTIRLTGWSQTATPQGTLVETSCDVTCQRGSAKSDLTVLNGKILAFNVKSEQMAGFFQGPTSTDRYEDLSKRFIRHFLAENVEAAHALCHQALQDVVPREQLQEMMTLVVPRVGPLDEISLQASRMDITDEADNLILEFEVVGSAGSVTCEITIEFVGLKGHLLGFNFH